jgi:hypothetical protein
MMSRQSQKFTLAQQIVTLVSDYCDAAWLRAELAGWQHILHEVKKCMHRTETRLKEATTPHLGGDEG